MAEGDDAAAEDGAAEKAAPAEEKPVTLGFKTFQNGDECFGYFHNLLYNLTKNQDLNEVCTVPACYGSSST